MKGGFTLSGLIIFFLVSMVARHGWASSREVVVYTALDQVYSEPILKDFEKETGIKVKAVYDIEATKTTGLVNRLLAEKRNPQCDVFWNNEVGRTIALKRKGLFAPYRAASARDIPEQFRDAEGYWTGFAARARVLVVNTRLLEKSQMPISIFEMSGQSWTGKIAIANPLFGTTATHVAALFAVFGKEKAKAYFLDLKKNGVKIVDGNSVVKDMVGSGQVLAGFTDTDDVNMGRVSGLPIQAIFPDKDGLGTLLIPNTVSLVANSPNQAEAKQLIEYLLSPSVEKCLAFCPSVQMPLRPQVERPENFVAIDQVRAMQVDFEQVADLMEEAGEFVQDLFIR